METKQLTSNYEAFLSIINYFSNIQYIYIYYTYIIYHLLDFNKKTITLFYISKSLAQGYRTRR